MKITVGKKIVIENPSDDVISMCKTKLTIPNPDFYKKQQLGKWTGNINRNIVIYEKDGDKYYLPFGCIENIFSRYRGTCCFDSEIASFEPVNYKSSISLYEYQEKAVNEAIRHRNGIIVMPCGAGKTQTALELISRIGGKCLWLTHTQDLMNQSMNRAKSVLGIDTNTYGTITGGKVNIGSGITFATVQTMCKIDLSQHEKTFNIIIVDECHKAIGTPTKCMQFYKVLSNLCCRYKFGLTATPKRADGLECCMYALIGEKIVEISKDDVKHTTCDVHVKTIDTGYRPDINVILSGDGTINYASLVDDLTHNKERNYILMETINNLDGATMVLGNRVEHLETLEKMYNGKSVCLSSLGNSKSSKKIRKEALKKLNCGELNCIFATYQLAKEGLDVPNLRYVVFATPEKDETTVTQSAGRVGRKHDGKSYGTVIDFTDDFGMLNGWAKKRKGFYKKLQYFIDI